MSNARWLSLESQWPLKLTMASPRFLFVDGLRGLAALAVVLIHIGMDSLGLGFLTYGRYGVTVFFILSGFVISHSLMTKKVTGEFLATFVIKRSLRLDPAYWVAIAAAIAVIWLPSLLFDYKADLPSLGDVVLHMFYLQTLFGVKPIANVFWTLCYEIQFYLVFAGVLYLLNKIAGSRAAGHLITTVFSFFFVISLFYPLGILTETIPGLFVNYWYLFLLGVFARWALDSHFAFVAFSFATLALLYLVITNGNVESLVATVTAILLYTAISIEKMDKWLTWKWVQYLGKISYSLYLVHVIFGLYVRETGIHLTNKYLGLSSLSVNYFWFIMALAASIYTADILYRRVEYPSHLLSRQMDIARIRTSLNALLKRCARVLKRP